MVESRLSSYKDGTLWTVTAPLFFLQGRTVVTGSTVSKAVLTLAEAECVCVGPCLGHRDGLCGCVVLQSDFLMLACICLVCWEAFACWKAFINVRMCSF